VQGLGGVDMSCGVANDVQVSATIWLRGGGFKEQPGVVGGVIIYVCLIVVQAKTMWPRATIIEIEDSEVDCLFTHLAFGFGNPCCYLAQTPSICGPFEEYVLTNHLLSCGVERYKHGAIWGHGRWLETRW